MSPAPEDVIFLYGEPPSFRQCAVAKNEKHILAFVSPDVPMRLTLATVNPLALHYGLSGASLDKISDGVGPKAPGYRLKKQGYERVLALYEADPEGFVLTYALVREMGNVQVVLLWDNVSDARLRELRNCHLI